MSICKSLLQTRGTSQLVAEVWTEMLDECVARPVKVIERQGRMQNLNFEIDNDILLSYYPMIASHDAGTSYYKG